MPPAKPAAAVAAKTKKVDLARAVMYKGRTYGPGKGVEVPEGMMDPKTMEERRAEAVKRNGVRTIQTSAGGPKEPAPEMTEEKDEDDLDDDQS